MDDAPTPGPDDDASPGDHHAGGPGCVLGRFAAAEVEESILLLGELAAMGAELAARVHAQAMSAERVAPELAAMFNDLALTVRRTVALRLRIAEGALGPPRPRLAALPSKPEPVRDPASAAQAELREAVPVERENLLVDLHERLDDTMANKPADVVLRVIERDLRIGTAYVRANGGQVRPVTKSDIAARVVRRAADPPAAAGDGAPPPEGGPPLRPNRLGRDPP
jgi:hypothetical protein